LEDKFKKELNKWNTIRWTGLFRFRARQVVGCFENGNENAGFSKQWIFVTS
jgi:hypothetical protein